MAIEVTFGVRGRTTKQALFIQQSDWELSLSEARKIIQDQELYVPLEYKFLTLNLNAIAQPSEDNLLLKDIAHNLNLNHKDEGTADLEIKSEKDDTKEKDSVVDCLIPEIWVTPLKVTFSSSNSASVSAEEAQGDETDPLLGDEANEENGASNQPTSEQCATCPFKTVTDILRSQGCLSPKTFLKIILGMTILLFALLASLTLTMHVMVRAFMSVSQSPTVSELFTKMNMGGASSETLTNLQVKLSQLEVSSKYEIERLETRLAELEDLYLRDLAVHKRELSMLKKQIAEKEGKVVDEKRNTEEIVAGDENVSKQNTERKNAEKKKKKENQRNKG